MPTIKLVNFIVFQIVASIVIVVFLFYIAKVLTANRFKNKFEDYVQSDSDLIDKSLEKKLVTLIRNLVCSISFVLKKFSIEKKFSKRFSKYLFIESDIIKEATDFISVKILLSICTSIFSLIFLLFHFSYYDLVICLLFIILSYLIFDIILNRFYMHYLKRINRDLFNAIHMINSSLNVGLSITQALKLVASKTDNILHNEFTNIYENVNNGLAIETSFNDLYERTKSEEVLYLSTNLALLSKLGGTVSDSFKILEANLNDKINKQKNLSYILLPYKYLFIFIGFIPSIVLGYKFIFDHHFYDNLISSYYNLGILLVCIVLNILYFILNYYFMEVRIHE